MGSIEKPEFTMEEATVEDMHDMAAIFLRALSWDPMAVELDKIMPFEEQISFISKRDMGRLTVGKVLGACRTWKILDENGKMVAWGGLGIPVPLTEDQQKAIKEGRPEIPKGFNVELIKCLTFFQEIFEKCLEKHGYDPTKHFMRQSTMVDTEYQRRGIGRMITRKCNEIADEVGVATFVRARPTSKKLFESEGYKVLEDIPMNYEEWGFEGRTAVHVMKREPGGK